MTNEPWFQDASWVRAAFPVGLRPDAAEVAQALPPPDNPWGASTYTATPDTVPVVLDGEVLAFPSRIYHGVLPADTSFVMSLSPAVTACAYTRHHDGHVRQRALRTLLDGPWALQPWVVPYVVKLVDEYVVEIVDDVAAFLTEVDVEVSPQQRGLRAGAGAEPRDAAPAAGAGGQLLGLLLPPAPPPP
ncbi:hypothetical protein ACWFNE_00515 [Cellulomonas sp. NPDC055163]